MPRFNPSIDEYGPDQVSATASISATPPISNARLGTPSGNIHPVAWDSSSAVARDYAVALIDLSGEYGLGNTQLQFPVLADAGLSHSHDLDMTGALPGNYFPVVYLTFTGSNGPSNIAIQNPADSFLWMPADTPPFMIMKAPLNPQIAMIVWHGLDVTTLVAGETPDTWLITNQANPEDPGLQVHQSMGTVPAASGVGYQTTGQGLPVGSPYLATYFPGGAPYTFQIQATSFANGTNQVGPVQATYTFTP
jgi:hypothetical protein